MLNVLGVNLITQRLKRHLLIIGLSRWIHLIIVLHDQLSVSFNLFEHLHLTKSFIKFLWAFSNASLALSKLSICSSCLSLIFLISSSCLALIFLISSSCLALIFLISSSCLALISLICFLTSATVVLYLKRRKQWFALWNIIRTLYVTLLLCAGPVVDCRLFWFVGCRLSAVESPEVFSCYQWFRNQTLMKKIKK